jgi:hypothetical protein
VSAITAECCPPSERNAVRDGAEYARNHGYPGSYSSLYRMIVSIRGETPPAATVPLAFAPGEAAQVDFGAGPKLLHPDGSVRRT